MTENDSIPGEFVRACLHSKMKVPIVVLAIPEHGSLRCLSCEETVADFPILLVLEFVRIPTREILAVEKLHPFGSWARQLFDLNLLEMDNRVFAPCLQRQMAILKMAPGIGDLGNLD